MPTVTVNIGHIMQQLGAAIEAAGLPTTSLSINGVSVVILAPDRDAVRNWAAYLNIEPHINRSAPSFLVASGTVHGARVYVMEAMQS
jgi:hypothetical protein